MAGPQLITTVNKMLVWPCAAVDAQLLVLKGARRASRGLKFQQRATQSQWQCAAVSAAVALDAQLR
jgi:hypothetical protein